VQHQHSAVRRLAEPLAVGLDILIEYRDDPPVKLACPGGSSARLASHQGLTSKTRLDVLY